MGNFKWCHASSSKNIAKCILIKRRSSDNKVTPDELTASFSSKSKISHSKMDSCRGKHFCHTTCLDAKTNARFFWKSACDNDFV